MGQWRNERANKQIRWPQHGNHYNKRKKQLLIISWKHIHFSYLYVFAVIIQIRLHYLLRWLILRQNARNLYIWNHRTICFVQNDVAYFQQNILFMQISWHTANPFCHSFYICMIHIFLHFRTINMQSRNEHSNGMKYHWKMDQAFM